MTFKLFSFKTVQIICKLCMFIYSATLNIIGSTSNHMPAVTNETVKSKFKVHNYL